MRRERIKFKDVDAIVTDAPIWLSCIYKELNEPKPHISKSLIDKQASYASQCGFEYRHIFLNRKKSNIIHQVVFKQKMRQKNIDSLIKDFLIKKIILILSILMQPITQQMKY